MRSKFKRWHVLEPVCFGPRYIKTIDTSEIMFSVFGAFGKNIIQGGGGIAVVH